MFHVCKQTWTDVSDMELSFTDLEVFSEYSLSFFELWRGEGQPGILVLSLILELWYVNDLRLGQLIHASKIYMTNKKSGAFV